MYLSNEACVAVSLPYSYTETLMMMSYGYYYIWEHCLVIILISSSYKVDINNNDHCLTGFTNITIRTVYYHLHNHRPQDITVILLLALISCPI